MNPYLRLFRIEHAFMLSFATLLSIVVLGADFPASYLILALLVPFLIEMGAFALNDYFDVEADRINKRMDRPLASGEINPKRAYILGVSAFLLANAIALLLGPLPFVISLSMTLLSWAYNTKLKDMVLVGNTFIALTMAMPFIYGAALAGSSNYENNLLIASAFLIGLGREIVKDVEDMEGDAAARGSRTLPLLIGKKNSLRIAFILFILFFFTSLLLMLRYLYNTISLVLFVLSYFLTFYASGFLLRSFSLSLVRKLTLLAMALGLLAVFVGAVW